MVGLGKIFGRSVKNFGRPEQFLKVWRKIRNVREKISGKMYGKKSRGSKILATRGRGDFVKFYLAPPKMRVAPQMPPQIPRPGAATAQSVFNLNMLLCVFHIFSYGKVEHALLVGLLNKTPNNPN